MPEHDPARTLVFHPNARSVVYFGAFRLDLADGLLSRGGEEIRLPPRALAILQHLVERAGRIVSKQALMDAAWKDAHVSETSLTEAIGIIRQTLGDDPQHPTFIQTVHRRGYRFIAPITTDAPPSPAETPPPVTVAPSSPVPDAPSAQPTPMRTRSRAIVAALAVATLAAAGVGLWIARGAADVPEVIRVSVEVPADQAPSPGPTAHPAIAISPDGERIVYVGGDGESARLYLRDLDRFEATPLAGSEGAHGPFFSPDGRQVGFFADGKLKTIDVTGAAQPPRVICATPTGVGGAWLSAGDIVFTPDWTGPLLRVPAGGGEPSVAAAPGPGLSYRWPDRLDDQTVIATRWRSSADDAAVVAISLPSGREEVIAQPATFGRAIGGRDIVFVRGGDVYTLRLEAHRPAGTPVRVLPAVLTGMTGAAQFAVSASGSVLYIPDVPQRAERALQSVDLAGRAAPLHIAPRAFREFAVCGERIAATIFERGETDLWAGDAGRTAMTRITHQGSAFAPEWSPDCRTIAFGWNRTGITNMYTVDVDSGADPRVLFESPRTEVPGSWSVDGRWLAYIHDSPETDRDVWLRDRSTSQRRPVIVTDGMELVPRLSPDARYVAYETNVSGRFEVEVASIQTGARVQVSSGGGAWPAWSADGRELFFLHDTTIMRLDVGEQGGRLLPGNPVPMFTHPDIVLFRSDGTRFVWSKRLGETAPLTRMNLILNWTSELQTRIP
ncbi:MAG TPA: winged helix-turn-helix domain-containing protein [Vicinamibacterales bacterium]|nr:winged helix-turn-helix domain-containing protein [Vicinamibacterales bacterium]